MTQIRGHILTPAGFMLGSLTLGDDGRIAGMSGQPCSEAAALQAGGAIVLPGFIDLHVHGGGGHDTMDGGDAVAHIARLHAQHGTTALLATTMTAPAAELSAALLALIADLAGRDNTTGTTTDTTTIATHCAEQAR